MPFHSALARPFPTCGVHSRINTVKRDGSRRESKLMRTLETIQSQKYLKKKDLEEQGYQELSEKVSGETRNKIRANG